MAHLHARGKINQDLHCSFLSQPLSLRLADSTMQPIFVVVAMPVGISRAVCCNWMHTGELTRETTIPVWFP